MTAELYIWIERWGDFQDFQKKRGRPWTPPWIKIYPRLLDEPRYLELTPEQRSLLVGLFMLFARCRGTITKDTRNLSRQLAQRITERQLDSLNRAGWITFCSGTVREQRWNAFWNGSSLEVEVEKEGELQEDLTPKEESLLPSNGPLDADDIDFTPAPERRRWNTDLDIQPIGATLEEGRR